MKSSKTIPWRVLQALLLILGPAWVSAGQSSAAVSVGPGNPVVEIAANAEYLLDPEDDLRYEDIIRGSLPFQHHTRQSFQFSFKKATLIRRSCCRKTLTPQGR